MFWINISIYISVYICMYIQTYIWIIMLLPVMFKSWRLSQDKTPAWQRHCRLCLQTQPVNDLANKTPTLINYLWAKVVRSWLDPPASQHHGSYHQQGTLQTISWQDAQKTALYLAFCLQLPVENQRVTGASTSSPEKDKRNNNKKTRCSQKVEPPSGWEVREVSN